MLYGFLCMLVGVAIGRLTAGLVPDAKISATSESTGKWLAGASWTPSGGSRL